MIPLHGARAVRRLRHLAAASLLLLLSGAGPAVTSAEEAAESPLRAGAWALEFEVDPEYQYGIGVAGSATLSAKRLLSDRSGLRFGVTLAFSEQDGEGETRTFRVTPSDPGGVSEQSPTRVGNESHGYAAFVHLVRHHPVRERLSIFWNLGPTFRYSEYAYADEYAGSYSSSFSREATTQRGVFLEARVGFEWLFASRLSLGARVGAYGGYQWGSSSRAAGYATNDGDYFDSNRRFLSLDRTEIHSSGATLSFSAYL